MKFFTPTFVDGSLYFLATVFSAFQTFLSLDDSAKWIDPVILFWVKGVLGSLLSGFLGLKAYRSTKLAQGQHEVVA